MEIYGNHPNYGVCRRALDNTPIHFMGIAYKAEMKAVYDMGSEGLYKIAITYGPYALQAMVCIYDPDLCLYFDYNSIMVAIHCTVEQTMMLYESEKSPFYRKGLEQ